MKSGTVGLPVPLPPHGTWRSPSRCPATRDERPGGVGASAPCAAISSAPCRAGIICPRRPHAGGTASPGPNQAEKPRFFRKMPSPHDALCPPCRFSLSTCRYPLRHGKLLPADHHWRRKKARARKCGAKHGLPAAGKTSQRAGREGDPAPRSAGAGAYIACA